MDWTGEIEEYGRSSVVRGPTRQVGPTRNTSRLLAARNVQRDLLELQQRLVDIADQQRPLSQSADRFAFGADPVGAAPQLELIVSLGRRAGVDRGDVDLSIRTALHDHV